MRRNPEERLHLAEEHKGTVMKSQILERLRAAKDYVSGQDLCEQLSVSRTAVWKQIQRLEAEGYQIEAVPRKGYRIIGWPDTIAADEVRSRLKTRRIGQTVRSFASLDSTNQYAKKAGEENEPEGLLVIADEQTAGKGRSGRRWTTPPGTTVAMTLLLRPKIAPEHISMVTLVMGMAIAKACRDLYGVDARIKWPNDIVVSGRKLSGTLTEMSAEMAAVNYIVIGVGINANLREFPEEIAQTATSLALELGRDVNRAELIAAVLDRFEQDYERFLETEDMSLLKDAYNEMLVNAGRSVKVLEPGKEYTGTALGINELGQLKVRREDETIEKVYAGEVSVRGIYGYV